MSDGQWKNLNLKTVFAREILSENPIWEPVKLFHPEKHLEFVEMWISFYEAYFQEQ